MTPIHRHHDKEATLDGGTVFGDRRQRHEALEESEEAAQDVADQFDMLGQQEVREDGHEGLQEGQVFRRLVSQASLLEERREKQESFFQDDLHVRGTGGATHHSLVLRLQVFDQETVAPDSSLPRLRRRQRRLPHRKKPD